MSKPTYDALMEQRNELRDRCAALEDQLRSAVDPAFTDHDPNRPFVEQVVIAAILSKGVGILSKIPIAGTAQPPQVVSHIREAVEAVNMGIRMLNGEAIMLPPEDPEAKGPDPRDDDSSDVTTFDPATAEALATGADL